MTSLLTVICNFVTLTFGVSKAHCDHLFYAARVNDESSNLFSVTGNLQHLKTVRGKIVISLL